MTMFNENFKESIKKWEDEKLEEFLSSDEGVITFSVDIHEGPSGGGHYTIYRNLKLNPDRTWEFV